MKISTIRLTTFISILVALIISIVLLFTLYKPNVFHGEPNTPNQFTPVLMKVIGIFAIHITVALTSYFSANYSETTTLATQRHYIAFSLVALWIIFFVLYIALSGLNLKKGEFSIEEFNKDIDSINACISFLISGALVFLFVDKINK